MLTALLIALGSVQRAPEPLTVPFPKGAHEPELAVADGGVVALVAATKKELFVAVSKDGARTFGEPVVAGTGGVLSVGMRRGPKIAVHGEQLCVVAIGGEKGGGKDGDVLAFTSGDLGATWKGPARINSVASSAREGLHALASGPKGELFCVWIDLRSEPPEVLGARSTDGGATWGENRSISGPTGSKLCPCCTPSVAIDRDGTVYTTWRGERDGARDLVLARSPDAFATPAKSAEKLGRSTWKIEMCPMDGGAVRAAGDDIVITWRSATTVFATTSRNVGEETELASGVQPFVAIGLSGAHVVWSEKRGGRLLACELGRELKSTEPRELAPWATSGVVAGPPTRGKGPVVAAWETSYGDDGKIQVLRLEHD